MFYLPESALRFIIVVGGLHGVFLGGVLFYIKRNRLANKLLAILVILWSISALARAYQGNQLYYDHPHLLNVFSMFALTWYPLLFLYSKYLISSKNRFNLHDLLHFVPITLRILAYIPYYVLSAEEKLHIYTTKDQMQFYDITDHIVNLIIIVQGFVYTFLVIRKVNLYQKLIKDFYSNVDKLMLNWLRTLTILGFTSLLLGIIGTFAGGLFKSFYTGILWDLVYLIQILLIYIVGYKALRFSELFEYVSKLESVEKTIRSNNVESDISSADYKRLKLYIENEKPYLNPELSLQSLADSLDMTRHQLSSLINSNYNKSFYDLVHEFRVAETLERLKSAQSKNYTIETIAYDSGFNSKATFNRVFKKVTGKTPSAYLHEIEINQN